VIFSEFRLDGLLFPTFSFPPFPDGIAVPLSYVERHSALLCRKRAVPPCRWSTSTGWLILRILSSTGGPIQGCDLEVFVGLFVCRFVPSLFPPS